MNTYERVRKYTNTLNGRLRTLVKGARKSAKDRNQDFAITYEDLCKLWEAQKGRCLYTGWDMSTITNDFKLVSIERMDNSVGYLPDNIVLVCWCVNRAKSIMDRSDFVDMCKAISKKWNT